MLSVKIVHFVPPCRISCTKSAGEGQVIESAFLINVIENYKADQMIVQRRMIYVKET
jgi:hypothetical protein